MVVLGRGHVQGVLAKDPAVRTEVQSVQERRRRERESSSRGADDYGTARSSAGPLIVFCGLDAVVLDASRGFGSWWHSFLAGLPWASK